MDGPSTVATAGLLAAGAAHAYAVTNDREHAPRPRNSRTTCATPLTAEIDRLSAAIDEDSVGTMCSVALRFRPESG